MASHSDGQIEITRYVAANFTVPANAAPVGWQVACGVTTDPGLGATWGGTTAGFDAFWATTNSSTTTYPCASALCDNSETLLLVQPSWAGLDWAPSVPSLTWHSVDEIPPVATLFCAKRPAGASSCDPASNSAADATVIASVGLSH